MRLHKDFFANERNYIHWLHMGVTLGSVSSLISAVSGRDTPGAHRSSMLVVSTVLVLCAIVFSLYAMYTFFWRRRNIRSIEPGAYAAYVDEPYGPLALSGVLLVTLITIFFAAAIPIQ
uniref:DUF202 domain-containing protein n=1 Tax=Hanusia phi TaxID=3032 RepID=A0A7S0DX68_9CRYP